MLTHKKACANLKPMQQDSFIRPDELLRTLGVKAEETVVHLGCGAGFYIIPAAKIVGRHGRVIGIDLLPDLLSEVESKAQREGLTPIIKTIRGNLENDKGSTLPEDSADWVLVANVLHQSDATKILHEARRIIKKEGHVIVIEWDMGAAPFGPPAKVRIPKSRVLEVIGQQQLKVTNEFKPSPYHYGLTTVPV